jgi:proline iminopeptidase
MARHAAVEPFDGGLLDVGDGQRLYWEVCGSADGKPAVVLHGGPGSGCSPGMRRLFDPDRYRVVLVDQRGAGRSLPSAADPSADLTVNTTAHLVGDLERVRTHLGIARWLVYGGSWGSTLALAYAQAHPSRVTELVLAPVTTTRRCEIDWLYRGVGRFFPAEWARFRAHVGADDVVGAYADLLADPDPGVRAAAARAWCDWEDAVGSLEPGWTPDRRFDDARFRLTYARLCSHYFRHGAWLEEGQLIRDAGLLAGVPGVLIHGRHDLGSPLHTAWQLHQAWPVSELVVVDDAGHRSRTLGDHLVAALDRLAT